jgi:formylglycine-generating enzyme required for sulfatase activity
MKWMQLTGSNVEISTAPVIWADYARFASETGRRVPKRRGAATNPVTDVSAADAHAFAEWLSRREGQHYRLPTLEEVHALAGQAPNGSGLWPRCSEDRYQVWRQAQDRLSEWLDCSPAVVNGDNPMNCIVHPAWLLNNHHTVTHGALANSGHSFVTFRLVHIERCLTNT